MLADGVHQGDTVAQCVLLLYLRVVLFDTLDEVDHLWSLLLLLAFAAISIRVVRVGPVNRLVQVVRSLRWRKYALKLISVPRRQTLLRLALLLLHVLLGLRLALLWQA